MAYIGNQPTDNFVTFATQNFSTSATSSYTLSHAVSNENEIALFINNVRQHPGSGKAYTATGTALTLSANTASTDVMYCIFLGRAIQSTVPATNSITAAMVGNDLVSGKDALAAEPADTDEFLVSDAGVLKRIDYSLIKGSGKILQIASTGDVGGLSQASTNSTTYADISGVDLVLTPTASSSKFVLFLTYNIDTGGDSHGIGARLTYNHSGISQTEVDDRYGNSNFEVTADRANTWQAQNYYLAPSTTNEITFRVQINANTNSETGYINRGTVRIIAMEYA